jgi:8-oxo-dGTP diphosphatase
MFFVRWMENKEKQSKIINVSCALILNEEGQLFAAQRSHKMSLPLKWELPGGKIEQGETPEQCLIREIKEELNIDIKITQKLPPNTHAYHKITVNLIPFICRRVDGEIELKEHAQFNWLNCDKLLDLDWADADIPILYNYLNNVNAIRIRDI